MEEHHLSLVDEEQDLAYPVACQRASNFPQPVPGGEGSAVRHADRPTEFHGGNVLAYYALIVAVVPATSNSLSATSTLSLSMCESTNIL